MHVAARRVVDRAHSLRGIPVKICLQHSSGIFLSDDGNDVIFSQQSKSSSYEKNKVILVDIPPSISEDLVNLYMKSAFPNLPRIEIEPHRENCRALVTFPSPIGKRRFHPIALCGTCLKEEMYLCVVLALACVD